MSEDHADPVRTAQEQYLWDPSCRPDPQVQALERALAPLRPAPSRPPSRGELSRPRVLARMGLAAAVLVVAAGAWIWGGRAVAPTLAPRGSEDHSRAMAGMEASDPGVQPAPGRDASTARYTLLPGQWLALTRSGAKVRFTGEGSVLLPREDAKAAALPELERGSVLIDAAEGREPVEVVVGGVVLRAAPGSFVMAEASVSARARIGVKRGWVGIERGEGGQVRLGEGTQFDLDSTRTPVRSGAGEDFTRAVAFVDDLRSKKALESGAWKADPLREVARLASRQDAATLWNMLAGLPRDRREQIAVRLAEMLGDSDSKSVEAAIALDPGVLERWWAGIAGGPPPGAK